MWLGGPCPPCARLCSAADIEHDWSASSTSARTPGVLGCWLLVANIAIVALYFTYCGMALNIATAAAAAATATCDDGHCEAPDALAGGAINETDGANTTGAAAAAAVESGAGNSTAEYGGFWVRTDQLGLLGLALIVLPENVKLLVACVADLLLVYVQVQTKKAGFIHGISTTVGIPSRPPTPPPVLPCSFLSSPATSNLHPSFF